jgi:hypothetical protein
MDARSILRRSALIALAAALQGCWPLGSSDATITQASRVRFIEPADGATVYTPFKIKLGVTGYTVRPAGPGGDSSSGHHHVIVDAGPIPEGDPISFDPAGATPHFIHWGMGQTEAMVDLPLGRHTLTAQFADGAHLSYGPLAAAKITVTVVGVEVAPPAPATTTPAE